MDVVETDELRILYFDPFQTHLVPHIVRNFHNSAAFQRRVFDWQPREKSTVILTDLSDYGNAGAGASPYNGVAIYIAPASRTLETMPSSERMFMIMNHELVHVANMDAANSGDLRWRRLFGGKPRQTDRHPETILYNYLTIPRLTVPRWYLEGAAVFMETWMSGGVGRAQGAYDEMVFRAKVRDEAHFYSNLGLVSEGTSIDFQAGANAYLYGTRFISYLALEYSPEKVVEWLKRGENSERYYSKQFKAVFGMPLEDAWDDWIEFEHQFQRENLDAVRRYPVSEPRHLVPRPLGSISRSFLDRESNTLLGAFRYPGVVAHVGAISLADGSIQRITDIKGPMGYRVTSSAWDPDSRRFFYTADNNAYRDLMAVNVDTGERQMLLKDARIGDIIYSPSDQSLWGLRHLNGYVSLVNIPFPYDEWNLVYAWPYGQVAYELDVSRDGTLLSLSLGEIDGSQYLKVFRTADMATDEPVAIAEFEFTPAVPEGFVFSEDNRYLYGSSFITGVSNILRFEIETGELEAVSNSETGLFRPIPMPDGSIVVFEYTGQGFVPAVIENPEPLEDLSAIRFLGAEIAKKHPVINDWNVISDLRSVKYDELVTSSGKYRPYRELQFEAGIPVIEGYRDTVSPGIHLRFSDPAQLHNFSITAGYSIDDDLLSGEKLHVGIEYNALNWHVQYWHNRADFYDLFGPTERARKGDAYIVGYEKPLIFDEPKRLDLKAQLGFYTGLDTLPANQNVSSASIDDILSVDLGLAFSDTRKSIGAVDHEKGWQWDLEVTIDDTKLETVTKSRAGLNLGMALPWGHSSLWLYNSAGHSNGARSNPLGNFYFGGFGNNYVDDGEVKRYRDYDSLPGFRIDEIAASSFVKSVAEWNLPPIRFREVGKPGFYLSHIRPALFVGQVVADPGRSFERRVGSAGVQLDLNFTIGHRLPMTLSIGYATGFENSRKLDEEWMASLKIL